MPAATPIRAAATETSAARVSQRAMRSASARRRDRAGSHERNVAAEEHVARRPQRKAEMRLEREDEEIAHGARVALVHAQPRHLVVGLAGARRAVERGAIMPLGVREASGRI